MSHPPANLPLFQMFGRATINHVPSINRAAFEKLCAILKRPLTHFGICTLLRAPRAGYGKSHLLCRLQQELRGTHEFMLLHAADGNRFDAAASLENVLTELTRPLPGGAGLTALDFVTRKLFALGLEPMLRSGEIPCQDRDSALISLQQRPTETFDFHHPSAATAHWARDHFEVLGPRLIVEISQLLQSPMRDITFWVDALFRYAVTLPEYPSRLSVLLSTVGSSSDTVSHDRLTALLHILSQWQRMVLVVDELEGLSANPEAALRLATFLTTLRHGAERVDVILSVNDDIWESAFVPRLSGGLLDRLTEATVSLAPLTQEEAVQLLQSRYPNASATHLQQLALDGELYARAVLRAAAQQAPMPVYAPIEPVASTPASAPLPVTPTAVPFPSSNGNTAALNNDWITQPAVAQSSPAEASPFQIATSLSEPSQPSQLFAVTSAEQQASASSPFTTAAPASTDIPASDEAARVNELLRQFRERYGNPSSHP
jgi:hypothetical protein